MTNEMEKDMVMETTEEVVTEEPKKESLLSKGKKMIKEHKKEVIGGLAAAGLVAIGVYLYVTGSKEAAESCSEVLKDVVPDTTDFISDVVETTVEEAV